MATMKDAKKVAKTLGANFAKEKMGMTITCRCTAPYRKMWISGGVHELVDDVYVGYENDYQDMIDRMNIGLEDCTDPQCDWCCEEE